MQQVETSSVRCCCSHARPKRYAACCERPQHVEQVLQTNQQLSAYSRHWKDVELADDDKMEGRRQIPNPQHTAITGCPLTTAYAA
jgi:hypothetical protein